MKLIQVILIVSTVFAVEARRLITTTPIPKESESRVLGTPEVTRFVMIPCTDSNPFVLCPLEQPIESTTIKTENTHQAEPELIDIGSYNGKIYFGDQVIRNWTDSYSFCKSRGLQLASIDNWDRQQTKFLKKACHKINYDGWFWVAENNLRGNGKLHKRSEEDIELCPFLGARDKRLSRRPFFNRHFTLCESVESIVLTTNAVESNGDEKYVEENADKPVESVPKVDTINRIFARLPKRLKKVLLDILILIQLMDGIDKQETLSEEFDILSSGTIVVTKDDILSSPQKSTDEDGISNARKSCEGIFC